MIDERLRGILYDYENEVEHCKDALSIADCRTKYISQIKALVIESLGKEKTTTDIEPTIGTLSPINYGQNLHIAYMKKKWK